VLQEDRSGRFGHQREHAALLTFGQFEGPREAGNLEAHDLAPAQDKGRIVKARAPHGRQCHLARIPDGLRVAAPCRLGEAAVGLVLRSTLFAGPLFAGPLFVWLGLRHGALIMPDKRASAQNAKNQAARLLAWYDVYRRDLPWRAPAGSRQDPYRVWLSEIMLQQTTVAAVADYYRRFLARWPTVEALAAAKQDEVLAAWAGLGYYARARNLHKAAGVVAREWGGRFPETAEGLRALPGIGPYTAGAIAAIAFDAREAAVDANAERVLARLYAVETPLPAAKPILRAHGQALMPAARAGDFVQALMDLGSAVCTPKRPQCRICPWADYCEAARRGIAESLPRKGAERVRPLKRGAAFVARDAKGAVLVVKRPEKGLLGGMLEPPLGPWGERFPTRAEALLQAPFDAGWKKRAGIVRHGFTHFELEIEVYAAEIAARPKRLGALASPRWLDASALRAAALPTVMRKIVAHGLDDGGPLFAQAKSARSR